MLGVSESDMINYHSVFADSGNSGAQVRDHYIKMGNCQMAMYIILTYCILATVGDVLHVRNGWSGARFSGLLNNYFVDLFSLFHCSEFRWRCSFFSKHLTVATQLLVLLLEKLVRVIVFLISSLYYVNHQIYTEGSKDVPKNYVKAMQYFEMAADQVRQAYIF